MPSPDLKTAADVSNYLLDITGRAMMSGDFETFRSCFHLPQKLETFDGTRERRTPDELRQTFEPVRIHYRRQGVTQLVRDCVSAEFKGDDEVHATHQAFLLAGTELRQQPFPGFSILKRVDGDWKITFSQYAITDTPDHNRALSGEIAEPTTTFNAETSDNG